MIRLFLSGGLGNQLFAYATARAIAIRNSAPLEIDLRFYSESSRGTAKGVWISELPVKASFRTYESSWISPHAPVRRAFERLVLEPFRDVFVDTCLGYNPAVDELGSNAVLIGYFQSYRYFYRYWSGIAEEIDLSNFVDFQWLANRRRPWAALHIRRGDYVGDRRFEMHDPVRYYMEAMQRLRAVISDIELVVFSDDVDWCERQPWLAGCEFYIGRHARHPACDMATMAQADAIAIANSSYSWWSAWLGQEKHRVTISPSTWIDGLGSREIDMVPPNWEVI